VGHVIEAAARRTFKIVMMGAGPIDLISEVTTGPRRRKRASCYVGWLIGSALVTRIGTLSLEDAPDEKL
jgi:hypothetical protein